MFCKAWGSQIGTAYARWGCPSNDIIIAYCMVELIDGVFSCRTWSIMAVSFGERDHMQELSGFQADENLPVDMDWFISLVIPGAVLDAVALYGKPIVSKVQYLLLSRQC